MAEINPIQLAEVRLLRNIWVNPTIMDDVEQGYSEDLFTHSFCKTIAQSIDTLTHTGTYLTTESLYMEAAKSDAAITKEVIASITEDTSEKGVYIKDITDYLRTVQKTTTTIDHLDHIKDVLVKNTVLTPDIIEEIKDSFEKAEEITAIDRNNVKQVKTLKEWGDDWDADYILRKNGRRYYFGEPVMDKLVTDGPIPGAGTLIVAGSGCGKSTFVMKLANGFVNAEIPCMFFSLEMGEITSYDRLLASRCQIPYTDIVNPPDEETFYSNYELAKAEREILDNCSRFRFCEDANVSLSDIKKSIIKFQEQIGQQYCIVIIDLVTMVQDFVKNKNGLGMAQQMEVAINNLNALAKELGIHVIMTAQLRRDAENQHVSDPDDVLRFRPTRAQVKNSGALLERARCTISLFRKKYYLQQHFADDEELLESEPDVVEVSVLKQNNGECLRLYESFEGSTFTMLPCDNPYGDYADEDLNEDIG